MRPRRGAPRRAPRTPIRPRSRRERRGLRAVPLPGIPEQPGEPSALARPGGNAAGMLQQHPVPRRGVPPRRLVPGHQHGPAAKAAAFALRRVQHTARSCHGDAGRRLQPTSEAAQSGSPATTCHGVNAPASPGATWRTSATPTHRSSRPVPTRNRCAPDATRRCPRARRRVLQQHPVPHDPGRRSGRAAAIALLTPSTAALSHGRPDPGRPFQHSARMVAAMS